jgi:phosphoribosyl 1,2-cyclic phosphodiesterase
VELDTSALRVKSLASGSSANALLVECAAGMLLVDAGLSALQIQALLREHALFNAPLLGILVTHEHSDHILGVDVLARKMGVPVIATPGTLAAIRLGARARRQPLPAGSAATVGPFEVYAFPVPHDAAEPVGFRIAMGRWRVGIAIDLGKPTRTVREALHDTDLTIIEANHDRARLLSNRQYPALLRRRIAGDTGHLANEQTVELLQEWADTEHDRWVWLAHLSQENNDPPTALRAVRTFFALLRRPVPFDVAVAGRDKPSVEWDTRAIYRQRALF